MVRYKNRYIIAEVVLARTKTPVLSSSDIYRLLINSISNNYGDYGVGMMQFSTTGMLGALCRRNIDFKL
jgi:hypothetical protein